MKLHKVLILLLSLPLASGTAAIGQTMDHSMTGMSMPGMTPPPEKAPASKATAAAKSKAKAKSKTKAGPGQKRAATPHAGHDIEPAKGMQMPDSGADQHRGHDMSTMPGMEMPKGEISQAPANQDMSSMPGMPMPAQGTNPHAGHDMSTMPGMQMQGDGATNTGHHDMSTMPGTTMGEMPADQTGTNLPAGYSPAPPAPTDHAADRAFSPSDMAAARDHLHSMHGGENFYQVLLNVAEYQIQSGHDGYRWDGEAWYGGDINRLWLKSEGEGQLRRGLGNAELQALYSRALDPYYNLQAGIRYDFRPRPSRTYATIGVEGLAPGFFEVEGALFLSDKGDLLARMEGYYDQRITQRLILQVRAEFNIAAQDVPRERLGAGITNAEVGIRLRYEFAREFAPYVGVSYLRKVGDTARFARAAGEESHATSFVIGVRTWF